jgi:hypothetical protein
MSVEELKNLRKKREELVEQIKNSAKELFKTASSTLFEEHPNLVKFGWTQYTPYFNDGDTCEFGSNHRSPGILFTTSNLNQKDTDNISVWEVEFTDYHYGYRYNNEAKAILPTRELTDTEKAERVTGKAVIEFLKNFDDDDMYGMFGDHQMVWVSKDGVISEEHDHE